MRLIDLRLGQRVRRRGDVECFLPDRSHFAARRVGIVQALPDRSTGPNAPVMVRWEGSDRLEAIRVQRLEALPSQAPGDSTL